MTLRGLLTCLGVLAWALAGADSRATQQVVLHIDAQPVRAALQQFGEQTGLQVLMRLSGKAVDDIRTAPVKGEFTVMAALEQLLADTGLRYEFVNDRTVRVSTPSGEHPVSLSNGRDDTQKSLLLAQGRTDAGARLSPAGAADDQSRNTPNSRATDANDALEEIVVTAQKREERLQDVPVPVTAVPAESLVKSGLLRLQDYYTKVPGLNLTMVDDGFTSVAIRGVTAGGIGSSPTVGIVVDDIPFGATFIVNGYGEAATDIDPSELARIEVLRGPQGTLYGANSMGGLLKFVTVDPSTSGVSGHVQVGTSSVSKGSDLGYSFRGAVNVALSDTFAIRASGSARRDPGYIDNVQSGEEDVNLIDTETGRLAALWRPNEDFSLKLSAQYQHSKRDGSFEVDLPGPLGPRPLSELQQATVPGTGWQEHEYQTYSAIITRKLGAAELTSLTGYGVKRISNLQDYSPALAGLAQLFFQAGGFTIGGTDRMTKISEELRFSTPVGERVDWMLGAFYTHENRHVPYKFRAVNPSTGAVAGIAYEGDDPQSYTEYAAFTDLTFKLTERFDVQVGARGSRNKITYSNTSTGIFNTQLLGQPFTNTQPELDSTETPVTYLFSPRLKVSQDLMVYARLASGYRPGGFNINPFIRAAGQGEFRHDTTENYEIGIKGNAFDQAFSFDASLYYIDWKDIQLQISDPTNVTIKYVVNAGAAVSKGAELSIVLKPLNGLTVSAWGAYNDAELTGVPANSSLTAAPGDRLPYSARRSGSLSLDQEFPLTATLRGFAGGSVSYVGERKGQFLPGGLFQGTFPAYAQVDLRAGVRFDAWAIDAFVNNATDKRGVLRNGHDSLMGLAYRVTYIQPRTIGLSLTRDF